MPCSNLRFLVVEDHALQSRVLVHLLQTMGAQSVHTAHDGQAALQVIRDPDRPVDIVVSDVSMPGMDGMEFIRHLSEANSKLSLILASSLEPQLLASVVNMARAYEVKLLGAVGKPLSAAKLVPLIDFYYSLRDEQPQEAQPAVLDGVADAWARNEFEPRYEPRLNLATRLVEGMSATPKWAHPVHGLLEADLFLPSLEAIGLTDDFVWLMVQKSAAQCRLWHAEGHALTVSVKVPFHSLTDANLAERIKQVVQKEGIEPCHMVLGIQEQALNVNVGKALENLARLRMDGFGLSIADFGTGRMAANQLSQVAFTELEIKSSFVGPMHRNAAARAELARAVEFAHHIKLKTVAVGIRSKEEWVFLKTWGCDLGQGPFISKPLEKGAVLAWLASRSASLEAGVLGVAGE